MARRGREISPSGMYHVILRGNKGLFFSDADYGEFLKRLSEYFSGSTKLYAYSLEKNRVHLAFYTDNNISDVLKPFCTGYARYVNRTHNKSGKLFYDRYISNPISDIDALTRVVCYISNKDARTSIDEYKGKKFLCSTDKVNSDLIINPKVIIPCTDDFTSMNDREIKKIILHAFGKKSSQIPKEELKNIIKLSTENSNLSKSRLSKIFGLKPEFNHSLKKEPEIVKKEPKKKQELSVWLL